MRNFTTKFLLVITTLLFGASILRAQTDITIGNFSGAGAVGNTGTAYPCPLQDFYEGSRMQYLYRAAELNAAGMGAGSINALRWNVLSLNTFSGTVEGFSIRIGTTTATSLSAATWEPGTVQVRAKADYVPVLGVNTFNFSTPFVWNGTDNIVVEVCNGDATNLTSTTYTSNVTVSWTTGLAFNGSHSYRADNLGDLCGAATTTNTGNLTDRPNIVFSWVPAMACNASVNGGTTVAVPTFVCLNQPFDLTVTGSTQASGLVYQWESSPNNATYTDISGATLPSLSTTQTASTWYRRKVTCTATGATATSTPVQVVSPSLVGGTFTINNTLPTGGTNFASFNDAYNYIKCGINAPVIFNVDAASGPYTEQLIINEIPGASNVNTVTFNGNGRTIQYTSSNTNERAVIKLNGADHFRFDSLVVRPTGTTTSEYGFGFHLTNNADSNQITRCTIQGNITSSSTNYGGIIVSAAGNSATSVGATRCDFNLFDKNKIIGGYYGITLVGSTTESVARNIVTNNTLTDQYFYATYLSGNFNTLYEGNDISRPTRVGHATLSYGIFVTSLNTSVKISKNRIHDPFAAELSTTSDYYAITHSAADALATLENFVTNNAIYNMNSNGTIYGMYNASSDNVWYHHNTVVINHTASTSTEAARGFSQVTTAGGIELKNNVFTLNRGGTGSKHVLYFTNNTTTFVSNRNNFDITPSANTFFGFWNGGNLNSLAAWQAGSLPGTDANSVALNPIYVNPLAGNFKPTNASMDALGEPVGITTDIIGDPRSATNPDMGAWEFAPLPCVAPPTAGTAISSITVPVCPNTPATFNLSGNTIGLTQTYQWEFSTTVAGTYSDVGTSSTNPTLNINVTQTGYYRCKVTCAGNTTVSAPVLVNIKSLLAAGTYTINKNNPPSATNFISFNAAYSAMECGISGPIILNVTTPAGTVYNEQLTMNFVNGSSATNTITWNGNGNVMSFVSSNTNQRGIIGLYGVKHMIFDSITINSAANLTSEYAHGFHLENNADSNIIRKCNINLSTTTTATTIAGIVLSGGFTATTTTNGLHDGNVIEGNTITGGYYGITVASNVTTPSSNNKIIGNKLRDYYLYGIYHSTANNTLIEGNELSLPTRTNANINYSIYAIGAATNLRISKNKIFDINKVNTANTSAAYGIYCSSDAIAGQEIVISNNAIYGFKGQGAHYGIYVFSDYLNVYHNTVDFNDQLFSGIALTSCLYYGGTSTANNIKNNIFTINKSGSAAKYGIYFGTVPTSYVSNNNNFYLVGNNTHVGFNGVNRTTLAAWQTATGQDAASTAFNPFYISPATGNYQPFSAAMDNKGSNVGISTDILNNTRSTTTPDVGAWEYVVPPCTAPPAVSTANAFPNSSICMGTDIALTLTNIVFGSGQTYQWQTATSATGPWTNLGGVMQFPDTTIVSSSTLYYRCVVTCSGQSTASTTTLVSLNPAFLAGTYTINPALPASATNFQTFNTAVAALYCGITGHVIFNVADGTYTEQVRVGRIPGVGTNATVTFQSASANPANVTLQFGSTVAANNYTLKLDSTGFFTFKDMTILGTNTTQARVVELASIANNNTFRNNNITAPAGTNTSNTSAAIFSSNLSGIGANKVIKNNITGGNFGVYLVGLNAANVSTNNVIDSNTLSGNFSQSILTQFQNKVSISANTVNMIGTRSANTYGINVLDCDSAIDVSRNIINISGQTTTHYGMQHNSSFGTNVSPNRITSNIINAGTGNTGIQYGIYQTNGGGQLFRNNVVVANSSGTGVAAGIYHAGGTATYENNSVNNISTSTSTGNIAAYFNQTSGINGLSNVRNNIFAHNAGGRAIYLANSNFVYSDYNLLYTNGATFGTFNTAAIQNLKKWVDTTNWDFHSISYKPAFISNTDLRPDLNSPQVWGMHGRGTQIVSNTSDFNGAARPTTLQAGVPDLGAYEFVPASIPENLVATPSAPVANGTQKFSLGTDTVAVIKWGANVPSSITGKRYTGTMPPGLVAGQQYMYFYTDFDVPAGSYNYEITQHYMDPWRGFIPSESVAKLGRTNSSSAWIVAPTSTVDSVSNFVKEPNLSFIDKYTVLTDGSIQPPSPIDPIVLDSSNMGTRFWVGYGHHQFFPTSNAQEMVLYIGGATTVSNVTVRINGTPWVKNFTIPANTVISSGIIPKNGLFDARFFTDGFNDRAISITSDVPIVAYAHIYGSASSGATMLMPVGVYGYEYYSTNFRQNYASDCFSWFYVIADKNNTKLEITPSNPTRDGRPANIPFVVTLNKGEAYQVLGAINAGSNGFDLSGSKVRSLPNDQNKCHPFAMFSGSSRTSIYCGGQNTTGNGDNLIQQNFPSQAWGKRYLVAPTSNSANPSSFHQNIFRVVVKDPTTIVQRNGVTLTGLVNNRFYEFDSQTADYITSDKPVMVAQYMSSSSSNCTNVGGNGDPEMIYVSPLEQGINNVVLYRNTQQGITTNDIQVIIPNGGLPSLRFDGLAGFQHSYPHPNLAGYTVVIRRYTAAATQASVKSDSAFTLITYGLGSVESYGYNGGTLVKNLNAVTSINNTLSTGTTTSPYTCAGTPFRFRVLLSVQPTQMTWQFSQTPGLNPNADVVVNNPVSVGTQIINGNTYYLYTLTTDYNFSSPGNYVVPVNIVHPTFEGCNSSQDITVSVTVLPKPFVNFTTSYSGCVGDIATFTGTATQNGSSTTTNWNWNFGDATTGTGQTTTKQYNSPGTYNVKLSAVGSDGCLGDTTKPVVVNPRPVVNLVSDSLSICLNTNGTFTVQSPVAGATYNWYNAATGGALLGTGTSYTLINVTTATEIWVEGIVNGCNSTTRKRAVVTVLPLLPAPVVVIDTVGVNLIRWRWAAVPGALSYSVSNTNGTTWSTPSSGATGLTHTITGLAPLTSVTLLVRANGGCQDAISAPVTGKTLTDQIYFPNSFTPNGDGLNDIWKVYGYVIKDLRLAIFNQWGEKIFESRNQAQGWNGEFKGKKQPAGVYMYIVEMTMYDGNKKTEKGSINLIQ